MTTLQSPRGMPDRFGPDYAVQDHVVQTFKRLARLYGFQGIATPIIENKLLFDRSVQSADIVQKEMFSLMPRTAPAENLSQKTQQANASESQTASEDSALSSNPPKTTDQFVLRPEGTAPVMRAILQHGLTQARPLKLFYAGPMFRYDRPQKGRLRQFHQLGLEYLGQSHESADLELIQCAQDLFRALGIHGLTLHINSLGCAQSRKSYTDALKKALMPHVAALSADSQKRLHLNPLRVLDSKSAQDRALLKDLENQLPTLDQHLSAESTQRFQRVLQGLKTLGIPFVHDPFLVRGLDYYTDTTFEFKTTALGAQGTVLAGGRFDGLSETLGGPPLEGMGWAAGIERLMLLMSHTAPPPQTLAVLPLSDSDQWPALSLTHTWRDQGIPCHFLAAPPALAKRFKKAENLGAAYAAIMGEAERNAKTVTLKNMTTGAQEAIPQNSVAETLRKQGLDYADAGLSAQKQL